MPKTPSSLSLPPSQTVAKLIGDFEGAPTYKTAHVFFLESKSHNHTSLQTYSKCALHKGHLSIGSPPPLYYKGHLFIKDTFDVPKVSQRFHCSLSLSLSLSLLCSQSARLASSLNLARARRLKVGSNCCHTIQPGFSCVSLSTLCLLPIYVSL